MTEPTDPTDPQDTAGETKLERWRRIMADMHADAPRPEESPLPAILEYLTSPEIMATMNEVVGDISLALASFLSDEVKQLRADLARSKEQTDAAFAAARRSNEQTDAALATARKSKEQTDTALAAVREATDLTRQAIRMAEELEGEVKQLETDLATLSEEHATGKEALRQLQATVTTLRGKDASAQELLALYAQRKKGNPSLTLRRFLDQIGASRRYRALISERTRLRRKQEDSAQPDTENERESEKGKQ